MQFAGDFRFCSWNGQALFARKCHRHHPKMRFALSLANAHDVVMLQETHGNEGREAALRLPGNRAAFWSDGTAHQAGVGMLISHEFLEHFNPVAPQDWVEVVPGRVAMLRLRGPEGALDLVTVYLPTGPQTTAEKRNMMSRLAQFIEDPHQVLTVLAGDFNFVTTSRDRVNKQSGNFTGGWTRTARRTSRSS